MRFAYPFIVLSEIATTVLSVPICNHGDLIARTEQESTSLSARVVNALDTTPAAARSSRVGSVPTLLEKRGNEKRQDSFGYSDYDDNPEKEKRQYGYGDYAPIAKAKRQDGFGYSDYDDKPQAENRLFDRGDYKPREEKRSDQVGNFPSPRSGMEREVKDSSTDISIEPEQGADPLPEGKRGDNAKRQFGYSSYDDDRDSG
ncbi:hypothetical protein EMCG_04263 [[Emmonsia] crescens]|uniref:Uncharacterized protein n=1 Tax=[Emmonsia] crescens TaxID=73230 RepID=A0A0G2HSV6_9EURO|nr:hypothetical protein EMCG_04263 [Emmonsia crescens UAMH 3008]